MRGKSLLIVVALTVVVLLFAAGPAFAGQATHIYYGTNNIDYYVYTPAEAGALTVTISWTGVNGTGAPVFPIAEVDGVVQMDNGTEPYADIDATGLYAGTNPQVDTVNCNPNTPVFVGVVPFIGQAPYRIVMDYKIRNTTTTVYDSGAINVANPNQKWARASSGEAYVPARGAWHSVVQLWNGSPNKIEGQSNWIANWDDYVFDRATYAMSPANNWVGTEMYPPVVTDSTLGDNPNPADAPAWYVICPEIWTAADTPNDWAGDPVNFINPKPPGTPAAGTGMGTPESVAYNTAPAWYTYSFPDGTANPSKPAYFLNQGPTNLNAQGRYYFVTNSISEQIKFDFVGDSVKWWFVKSTAGGIINVSISNVGGGTYTTTVDQNGAPAFTSQTFSALGAGAHTITLQNSGAHSAGSTGYNFYHDAFEATTDAADVNLLADNGTDGSTWQRWIISPFNAGFYGGYQSSNNALNAVTAFTFQGTAVDLIYTKTAIGGTARVYIDGVDKGIVNMYNASAVFQAVATFGGLTNAWHTVFVVNDKTTSGSNYYVYIDAFRVGGTYYDDTP